MLGKPLGKRYDAWYVFLVFADLRHILCEWYSPKVKTSLFC